MTKQELYSKVRRHLLKQKKQSIDWQSTRCAYRGSDGLKCAIGCLIPERRYKKTFEGKSVTAKEVMKAAGIRSSQLPLACCLQNLHDLVDPAGWNVRLDDIAAEFDLRNT